MKVFVYGTLLSNLSNFRVMQQSKGRLICKDSISARMFNSNPHYPFITLKDSLNYTVCGELYEVKSLTLLDQLEGYNEKLPPTFYNRSIVTTKNGHKTFVYDRSGYEKPCNWIITGDWRQYYNDIHEVKELDFHVANTNFPLPKKDTSFYVQLLEYLQWRLLTEDPNTIVSIPTFAYRSIEYASEKTGIKIHRIYNKEHNCYNISLPLIEKVYRSNENMTCQNCEDHNKCHSWNDLINPWKKQIEKLRKMADKQITKRG